MIQPVEVDIRRCARRGRLIIQASFAFLVFFIASYSQGPALLVNSSRDNSQLVLNVMALNMPSFKTVYLTMQYPGQINMPEAVISSPLPGIALGAELDTSLKELFIPLAAVGPVDLSDSAAILRLSVPVDASVTASQPITLLSADVTDPQGNAMTVSISHQEAQVRLPGPCGFTCMRNSELPPGLYTVDGRRVSAGSRQWQAGIYLEKRRERFLNRATIRVR